MSTITMCDGCRTELKPGMKYEKIKTKKDMTGDFCNKCAPKVHQIVGEENGTCNASKKAADDTLAANVAYRIAVACPPAPDAIKEFMASEIETTESKEKEKNNG